MSYNQKLVLANVRTFIAAKRTARALRKIGAGSFIYEAEKLAKTSMKNARFYKAKL